MTEEEKKSLVQDVLSSIKASSQSVDELETVGSLDGINSLPAQRGDKLVKAPISLLAKPATEAAGAADKAAKAANGAAAGAARTAASNADTTPIQRQISCNIQNDKKMCVNANIYSI